MLGYHNNILRVDLGSGKTGMEQCSSETLHKLLGGAGLGARYLYDELAPEASWDSPENVLCLFSGPLGGTRIPGSANFCVVTRGALTEGAASTQANGFLGAFLRHSGFDGVVIKGAAPQLSYLYIHDGTAEIRDARHLAGKDTRETAEQIKSELGKSKRGVSVFAIGPAGENLVRFAAIIGDEGHSAGHNGSGAVMGAKRLKAIVVERGRNRVPVHDAERLSHLGREVFQALLADPRGKIVNEWGMGAGFVFTERTGRLPVRNLTTSVFPEKDRFMKVRSRFPVKPNPCWGCPLKHCNTMTVAEGPYAGFVGEEPDHVQWAAWGPQIGNTDPGAAVMLTELTDLLGLEVEEAGWLMGWLIECSEKGLLSGQQTDGIKLRWGDAEAVRQVLERIAHRQGCGDMFGEGIKRVAGVLGGEAEEAAVYGKKGAAPRLADGRNFWLGFLDSSASSTGTGESGQWWRPVELGASPMDDFFSADEVVKTYALMNKAHFFMDTLGVCFLATNANLKLLVEAVCASTGWDFRLKDAALVGWRVGTIFRAINERLGITGDADGASPRYKSVPVDGPGKGREVDSAWRDIKEGYYREMGWDAATGRPLPESLRKLGLEFVIPDVTRSH
jgi:aldehyde:ferredoxin oxidoreductase